MPRIIVRYRDLGRPFSDGSYEFWPAETTDREVFCEALSSLDTEEARAALKCYKEVGTVCIELKNYLRITKARSDLVNILNHFDWF